MATPIGNLADISLRALQVLGLADVIACEDTRHTHSLLRAYGIDKSSAQLLALHQHNESEAAHSVIARLRAGQRVAYVSDAGTPGISDPGARLVALVRAQDLRVVPLPGASSITTLLSAAGVLHDSVGETGFVFAGFLPSKAAERAQAIGALAAQRRAFVLLEAPHRIEALALALKLRCSPLVKMSSAALCHLFLGALGFTTKTPAKPQRQLELMQPSDWLHPHTAVTAVHGAQQT